MKNKILIGTFCNNNMLPRRVLREITEFFDVDKIFVFDLSLSEDSRQFLFTYNISKEDKEKSLQEFKQKYRGTIQLHRNKESNTLFTINSLNAVLKTQNTELLEENKQNFENYKVDWTEFKNSCVLLDKFDNLKIIPTRLYDVVDFE